MITENKKYVILKIRPDNLKRLLEAYYRNREAIDAVHEFYLGQAFKDFEKIYKERVENDERKH